MNLLFHYCDDAEVGVGNVRVVDDVKGLRPHDHLAHEEFDAWRQLLLLKTRVLFLRAEAQQHTLQEHRMDDDPLYG